MGSWRFSGESRRSAAFRSCWTATWRSCTGSAIAANIRIMRAFVAMRHALMSSAGVLQRLGTVEVKLIETDKRLDTVFDALIAVASFRAGSSRPIRSLTRSVRSRGLSSRRSRRLSSSIRMLTRRSLMCCRARRRACPCVSSARIAASRQSGLLARFGTNLAP